VGCSSCSAKMRGRSAALGVSRPQNPSLRLQIRRSKHTTSCTASGIVIASSQHGYDLTGKVLPRQHEVRCGCVTGRSSSPVFLSKVLLLPFPPAISKLNPASKIFRFSHNIIFAAMSSHTYTPLEDKSESGSQPSEDSERLLGSDSETVYRKPSRKIPVWVLIVLIPLISLSLIAFGAWIGSRWFTNINEVCLAHVQHYCKFRPSSR